MSEQKTAEQSDIDLRPVSAGDDLAYVKTLFVEYAEVFDHQHCFKDFERELAAMPDPYLPPSGALFLASVDGRPAGCVAIKPLGNGAAELKRLYVRQDFRGHSLGRRLTETAIDAARNGGHKALKLETLPGAMAVAISVYRTLGFEPCDPYGEDPVEAADHYELRL